MADLGIAVAPVTIGNLMRRATRQLAAAGIEGPGRDARRLVGAATGLAPAELIVQSEAGVAPEAAARLDTLLQRRLRREPVSRILGEREFYGRPFIVTPATLDPRPDSETLIEAALELVAEEVWRDRPLRILDVGTGTGCLLLTLLAELPQATGVGTDISAAALEVAARNAAALGLTSRATFRCADALDAPCGTFDMLVSNPPYIARGDISGLAPEVAQFDPIPALDGGEDGLDIYRRLMPRLRGCVPGGWAVFEVGVGQASDVLALAAGAGVSDPAGTGRVWRDLDGRDRCVAMKPQR